MVLVIIGLIMGLVGPRLFGQADKAKVQTAETQIKMLGGALQTMRLDISRWPTEQEGLALLTTKPADATRANGWAGPYLDDAVPLDPWGHPYQYAPVAERQQPVHAVFVRRGRQVGRRGPGRRHRLACRAQPRQLIRARMQQRGFNPALEAFGHSRSGVPPARRHRASRRPVSPCLK